MGQGAVADGDADGVRVGVGDGDAANAYTFESDDPTYTVPSLPIAADDVICPPVL